MDLQLIKRIPFKAGTCLAAVAVSLDYWSSGDFKSVATLKAATIDFSSRNLRYITKTI
jgi:hypothetical protein